MLSLSDAIRRYRALRPHCLAMEILVTIVVISRELPALRLSYLEGLPISHSTSLADDVVALALSGFFQLQNAIYPGLRK